MIQKLVTGVRLCRVTHAGLRLLWNSYGWLGSAKTSVLFGFAAPCWQPGISSREGWPEDHKESTGHSLLGEKPHIPG